MKSGTQIHLIILVVMSLVLSPVVQAFAQTSLSCHESTMPDMHMSDKDMVESDTGIVSYKSTCKDCNMEQGSACCHDASHNGCKNNCHSVVLNYVATFFSMPFIPLSSQEDFDYKNRQDNTKLTFLLRPPRLA